MIPLVHRAHDCRDGPAGSHARARRPLVRLLLALLLAACSPPQTATAPNPDVNGDGRIDILDISLVSSCVDRDLAAVCGCRRADVDHDGAVTGADVALVQERFGESGLPVDPGDTEAPELVIQEPADGSRFFSPAVRIVASVDDPLATLTANGVPFTRLSDPPDTLEVEIGLDPGSNIVVVAAGDRDCNESTALLELLLVQGPNPDVNRDGVVNILDISRASSCVDQNPLEVCACRVADVDGDGRVDLEDVGRVQLHFGEAGYPIEPLDDQPPLIQIQQPLSGAVISGETVLVIGSVDDAEASVSVNGIPATVVPGSPAGFSLELPVGVGETALEIVAGDLACNRSSQVVRVSRPATLERIALLPAGLRLTEAGASRTLQVVAQMSDGTSQPISAASVVFESDNGFVAGVDAGGVVTAVASGVATVVASHQGMSASAAVLVEIGGSAWSGLELSIDESTLRGVGAQAQLSLVGFAAGEPPRDLTAASSGTAYQSSDPAVLTVSPDGEVSAVAAGGAVITAQNSDRSAEIAVTVTVSGGRGLLLGHVFDDAWGVPLPGAEAHLLFDGRGPVAPGETSIGDQGGRFALAALEGEALVRVSSPGYTGVERRGWAPVSAASTLLDARLTPLDAAETTLEPALGGVVSNAAATHSLAIEAGALSQLTTLRITPVGGQGLEGRLPLGWSPIAAVDVHPHEVSFSIPAELRLPNETGLPAEAEVTAARYDGARHRWIAQRAGRVSADRSQIVLSLNVAGQVALLLPDPAPHTPAEPLPGDPLQGVAAVPIPDAIEVLGEVAPERRAVGDELRAVGRVEVASSPEPLPSGSQLVVNVREEFNLLDTTRLVPQPFSQDVLLYARPGGGGGGLSARFAVSPSLEFEPGELALGTIHLEVTAPGDSIAGTLVGPAGGVVGPADGDRIEIPLGAAGNELPVDLRRLPVELLDLTLPEGFELLAALSLDLAGAGLSAPATLSIPRPAGLESTAQVVLARVMTAPDGVPRLHVVALATISPLRVASSIALGPPPGETLSGVTRGGQYLFIVPASPLAFLRGTVTTSDGGGPQPLALVTAEGLPFADQSDDDGGYRLAASARTEVRVNASLSLTGDATSVLARLGGAGSESPLDLALEAPTPAVTATSPDPDAVDVARSSSILVVFSRPMDPESIDESNVVLSLDGGAVPAHRRLSLDGRQLSIIPDDPLASATRYSVSLAATLSDLAGHGLAPFPPFAFTTIDTAKPPPPPAGQITARLPDGGGRVEIAGTQGSAEARTAVTVTNLRTAETFTVLALADGSFRLQIHADNGDPLSLTFRDAERREVSFAVEQLEDADGRTGIGSSGGRFADGEGRAGSLLPGSLTHAGVFRISPVSAAATLPALSSGFRYVDVFDLEIEDAVFERLTSLDLRESQDRFTPLRDVLAPFASDGLMAVPADYIVGGSLRFTAVAQDRAGHRESLEARVPVRSSAGGERQRLVRAERFPKLVFEGPAEAIPGLEVRVRALAPTARVDFDLPLPAAAPPVSPPSQLLLVRVGEQGGEPILTMLDELVPDEAGDRLLTVGHQLPGVVRAGRHAVVLSDGPLAFIGGRLSGPAATARVEGTPFVLETDGPNAGFYVAVRGGQPFTLRFVDPGSGDEIGSLSGNAPASGELDLGAPFGAVAERLEVEVEPRAEAVVEIDDELVFRFSEALDTRTVSNASLLITNPRGVRVFGDFSFSDGDRVVRFRPDRRWRFATTYRYGVSTGVLGLSGASLNVPESGAFTTFEPSVVTSLPVDDVRDVALEGDLGLAAGASGVSVLDLASVGEPAVVARLERAGGAGGVALFTALPAVDAANGELDLPYAVRVAENAPTGVHSFEVVVHLRNDQGSEIGSETLRFTIEVKP